MVEIPPMKSVRELNALIIDEESLVHDLIHSCWVEMGFGLVNSAQNAYFAVRRCEEVHFDIFFIAFNVASDKDGFHLLEELKFKGYITSQTTVIFLSGDTDAALVHCVVEMQPSDFWVKPLDRKKVSSRLEHIFAIKKKLYKLHYCADHEQYSTAVYLCEQHIKRKELAQYFPNINRLKGECLLKLFEYEDAEEFYRGLLEDNNYGWISIGLVRAMLAQGKITEAESLITSLKEREDTRFLMYDTLARYYIEREEYKLAYEEIKTATTLAPRNIDRNHKYCDLARLNHDRMGQFIAAQNVAKYAKNSIHDSPELKLNVVRSAIDLATSLTDAEATPVLRLAQKIINRLEAEYGRQLSDELSVVEIRMLTVQHLKRDADKILKDKVTMEPGKSIEETLDKVKAFHELGHRENALKLLEKIKAQIAGDSWSSRVVAEYVEQEKLERKDIHFTAKELGEMAQEHFKEKRIKPAYQNLSQAFKLSPANSQLAMSLLRLMSIMVDKENEKLDDHQNDLVKDCIDILKHSDLESDSRTKFERYARLVGHELED
ncbi:MAG: response regulator [Alteromonadaceae bacterium]|nr:response regulator [Alteromonadaceae bacterium]